MFLLPYVQSFLTIGDRIKLSRPNQLSFECYASRHVRGSNPLGWEGDARRPDAARQDVHVSNPLGWEGDYPAARKVKYPASVSNPLGWEGDFAFLSFFF